jgi:hypothetical protein
MNPLCESCKKAEVSNLKWWERLRLYLFRFFTEEAKDLSVDASTKGFGSGYRIGFEAAKQRSVELSEILQAIRTERKALSLPSAFDLSSVLDARKTPLGIKLFIEGREADNLTVQDLKDETSRLRKMRIWGIMSETMKARGLDALVNKSADWEEASNAKTLLHFLALQASLLEAVESAVVPEK